MTTPDVPCTPAQVTRACTVCGEFEGTIWASPRCVFEDGDGQ